MAPELSPLKAGYDEYCRDQRGKLPDACIDRANLFALIAA
jgi:hypothetical protein